MKKSDADELAETLRELAIEAGRLTDRLTKAIEEQCHLPDRPSRIGS
jgi:hypothetical protein